MSGLYIYLDESGDLGWSFNNPYRNGGSSRHLTIVAVIVPTDKRHIPKRALKKLYKKLSWNPKKEKKWSEMNQSDRVSFAEQAKKISDNLQSLKYYAITVKKKNVGDHIRQDSNKLYNYMIKLLLIEEMAKHRKIVFVPDPRSIRVESGSSLHDYLQMGLWFDKNVKTILETTPGESSVNLNVQFADMLSGAVQSHYEDNRSEPWNIIRGMLCRKDCFLGNRLIIYQ